VLTASVLCGLVLVNMFPQFDLLGFYYLLVKKVAAN